MFDWNDLRYFLAVARTGSTIAAAKALGWSQSTVQRRLARLERQLGCKLLERHPTGYRLTALGEDLRRYAEQVEEAVAVFERHLAASDKRLTGTVRVSLRGRDLVSAISPGSCLCLSLRPKPPP